MDVLDDMLFDISRLHLLACFYFLYRLYSYIYTDVSLLYCN
jgi:hypothetical protein